jgi:hypothetical protein
MPKVMLRLRDLSSGEAAVKELGGIDEAVAWLRERPRMTEVLGVVFDGISREDNERMKAAMRPLEVDEATRARDLDDQAAAEREKQAEARRAHDEAQARAIKDAAKTADPNRPMELKYRYDQPELANTDPNDDRPVTDAAKEAVMAWVHERMEWVAGRGQTVGEAKVTVYPATVPAKAERVVSGSFVPVTAAAKGEN